MNIETNLKGQMNGLPPQLKPVGPPTQLQFNGVTSNRYTNIPPSQLPPSVNQLAQNVSHLSVTPNVSPNKQNFSTSTPIPAHEIPEPNLQVVSPIVNSEILIDRDTGLTNETRNLADYQLTDSQNNDIRYQQASLNQRAFVSNQMGFGGAPPPSNTTLLPTAPCSNVTSLPSKVNNTQSLPGNSAPLLPSHSLTNPAPYSSITSLTSNVAPLLNRNITANNTIAPPSNTTVPPLSNNVSPRNITSNVPPPSNVIVPASNVTAFAPPASNKNTFPVNVAPYNVTPASNINTLPANVVSSHSNIPPRSTNVPPQNITAFTPPNAFPANVVPRNMTAPSNINAFPANITTQTSNISTLPPSLIPARPLNVAAFAPPPSSISLCNVNAAQPFSRPYVVPPPSNITSFTPPTSNINVIPSNIAPPPSHFPSNIAPPPSHPHARPFVAPPPTSINSYPTNVAPPPSNINVVPSNVAPPPSHPHARPFVAPPPTSINSYPTNVAPHNVPAPAPPPSNINVAPPSRNINTAPYITAPSNTAQLPIKSNRYPARVPNFQQDPPQNYQQNSHENYRASNVVNEGFNKGWGYESTDLLQCTTVLPTGKLATPKINLGQAMLDSSNCNPDIFRCTVTKIPDTSSLLQKSRLPLGVLIHPFKDLDHLPVIQCTTIVRCRACRTYINPFVYFVDTKRWKCNLCYRVNELPEEFQFDPVSKTYGDPSRRPEIKSSTIEYIAPSEYMLRPPQPAVYLFLLDVSRSAIESGYLTVFCDVLTSSLNNLPGDARTQIGFIAYNSALHFYLLSEGLTQPHEMTVLDTDDIFLPCPDNLIVNLQERKELIGDLLTQLPTRFNASYDTGSALGAALQAAHKMISATGGRITVFQATLPNSGPGTLTSREDPSQRAGQDVHHLNPANDFYKRLALDCNGQQIAVDLFVVNSQYVDLATISGISQFSGGCVHHFPLFKASRILHAERLERCFKRYLTRKIGFEAVMRVRCTRGLSIHTFHGNFFVRSTNLLSLPNVNPEAGFGMQVAIEESLSDINTVCFQAALLYTSSKGERRIRVHTLCVPIASTLPEIMNSADQQCIIGLLAKMAVDRSMSSLSDAREAFINVAIDILSSYKLSLNLGSPSGGLLAPGCLKLLPLYISGLLKFIAFRTGTSTRLDDRVKAMCDMKTSPLCTLIQNVYPDLYPVHNLETQPTITGIDGESIPQPPHLQLTARCLDSKGAFLLDMGDQMVLLVGSNVSHTFLNETLGVPDYNSITEEMYDLPILNNPHNQRLHDFVNCLNDDKPYLATLHIMRDNSPNRGVFVERLIEDRVENALSYHEFLQHLKTQVK